MRRRFDVFRNPNPASARQVPWLLLVQSELLDALATQVVVPLVRPTGLGRPLTRLNPVLRVEGEPAVMLTQQLGAVPTASLKRKVASLEASRSAIIGALDFLMSGV